jgi:hypothetical protein
MAYTTMQLGTMVHHALIAALWTSTDDGGTPLDEHCEVGDYAPCSVARMRSDCAAFLTRAGALVAQIPASYGAHPDCGTAAPIYAAMGHDFWLTRNGHGAGFWDRGLPGTLGDELSALADAAGNLDAYIGDDAMIHFG